MSLLNWKRGLRRLRRQFSSAHLSYLLLHLFLVLGGWFLMSRNGHAPDGSTLHVAVGASLVATGIAGTVLFLRVWIDREEDERVKTIRDSGLRHVFNARSVGIKAEYDDRLATAHEAIDIMGFGLRHLREDHDMHFEDWAKRATVRILVLDPDFPSGQPTLANLRDKEELGGNIEQDVRSLITSCKDLLSADDVAFDIRLYQCLPSVNLFRIDGDVFWGPYLIGEVSRNMPTLLMETDGTVARRLLEHFDRIWTRFSREIPKEWLRDNELGTLPARASTVPASEGGT